MTEPDEDRTRPPDLRDPSLGVEEAAAVLARWHQPRPRRWLRRRIEEGRIRAEGDRVLAGDLWRELLRDECDKLYNQAWCALERIREAEDPDSVMMLAMDDLPSAVEQAFALAPSLAGEHVALLGRHRVERVADFRRELAVGTPREAAERIECLAFWEENAEGISDLRRTLFRLVREGLERGWSRARRRGVEVTHGVVCSTPGPRRRSHEPVPVADSNGEVLARGSGSRRAATATATAAGGERGR